MDCITNQVAGFLLPGPSGQHRPKAVNDEVPNEVDQKRPDKGTGFDHALRGYPAQIPGQHYTEGTARCAEVMH